MEIEFEPITGKYFKLDVAETSYRIYMEESGSGIPLLCLHTAGSDARQFRHILCDHDITSQFRVIAFDMPWHGKSNPPKNFHTTEYKLTVDSYKNVVSSFISALDIDKPVLMGCSM